MPNYAVCRAKKIKSLGSLKRALQHNRRERIPKNANPEMLLNDRYCELCDRGVDNYSQAFEKARKNSVYAVEWVFSGSDMNVLADSSSTTENKLLNNWVQDNINFVASKMGGKDNILSATYHFDEKTPHMHIIVIPQKDGKLNCRHYLGGTKYVMRNIQEEYCNIVKKYGFERGISKEKTHRYNHKPSLAVANKELEKIENKLNTLEEECKKKIKRNNELRQELLTYGFTEKQILELGKGNERKERIETEDSESLYNVLKRNKEKKS